MQHVNIKIFSTANAGLRLSDAIPVFHRWIQSRNLPELLIDVADYTHVPEGPGVVLIGHEANYALDNAQDRPGLLYSRKAATDAAPEESLKQAYDSAVAASRRLESEPEFQGKLRFDPKQSEITWNDRLLYPNTAESWTSIEPSVRAFVDGIFGGASFDLRRRAEARERLSVLIAPGAGQPSHV